MRALRFGGAPQHVHGTWNQTGIVVHGVGSMLPVDACTAFERVCLA